MQKCKKLYRGLDMRILTCYNNIIHPGIAKLVSRLVWDQETVRSSRTTRTKIPLKSLISEGFFLFFVYCGAGGENGKRIITNTGTHSHFLVEKGEYLWYY